VSIECLVLSEKHFFNSNRFIIIINTIAASETNDVEFSSVGYFIWLHLNKCFTLCTDYNKSQMFFTSNHITDHFQLLRLLA